MIGIYSISNVVNSKVYVGSSKDIQRRWKEHLVKLRLAHKGKHQGSPSDETKDKIRQTLKVQRVGSGNPAFGKPAHNRKHVRQMTKDGVWIRTFESLTTAASACGGNRLAISFCCYGKTKSSAGFVWEFCDA